MKSLIFNTTTNGFVDEKGAAPHLVAVAAILEDEDGEELDHYSSIVKLPSGRSMLPDATKFHGITTAMSNELGVPLSEVMQDFASIAAPADRIVAYNMDFHVDVIATAAKRTRIALPGNPIRFCVMREAVDICRIPDRSGNYKFPRLAEAYAFFQKETLSVDLEQGPLDILDQQLRAVQTVFHKVLIAGATVAATGKLPPGKQWTARDEIP